MEAPSCDIQVAAEPSAEGDTLWVASDGEDGSQDLPNGRTCLGGYDASAGWVRDTEAHPTVIVGTFSEPYEDVPGFWQVDDPEAVALNGSSPFDTVIEGFDISGNPDQWSFSFGVGTFYLEDVDIVGTNNPNIGLCTALSAGGDLTADNVTVTGCDGVPWGDAVFVNGTLRLHNSTDEVGAGATNLDAIEMQPGSQLFATASVVPSLSAGVCRGLVINGVDSRVEAKNSAFLARGAGATVSQGMHLEDGTLIASSSYFAAGAADEGGAIEALSGTVTHPNIGDPGEALPARARSASLAWADMDGDGDLDLASVSSSVYGASAEPTDEAAYSQVDVHRTRDGAYEAVFSDSLLTAFATLTWADIDLDEDSDRVVGHYSQPLDPEDELGRGARMPGPLVVYESDGGPCCPP